MPMSGREAKSVKSVGKALHLLDIMAQARKPLSLGELSVRSGWPKSTVYGLLTALREGDAVEQRPENGHYYLGLRMFEYGCAVSDAWDILAAARVPMTRAAQISGESVFLSTLDRGEALILDRADAAGALRVISEIGARLPAHCTSQGKLLLAYTSAGERRHLLRETPLQAFTPHTIIDPDVLDRERDEILQQGFAVENGEYRVGLRSVSAPVRDAQHCVRWAVTISGMLRKQGSDEFTSATRLVIEAAAEISRALGWRE